MEAFNFTVANEDCSLYTYDMRRLQSASCVHKVCYKRQHISPQLLPLVTSSFASLSALFVSISTDETTAARDIK